MENTELSTQGNINMGNVDTSRGFKGNLTKKESGNRT